MAAIPASGGKANRVRFDDKLATVLARPLADAGARAATWRQVVDILAQDRDATISVGQRDGAFALLRRIRNAVPAEVRAESVLGIACHRVPAAVVAFVAEDAPAIGAPLIAAAALEEGEWIALLPRLSPPARALLRHRRDLPTAVRTALGSFGSSDFALGGEPRAPIVDEVVLAQDAAIPVAAVITGAAEPVSEGEMQIRDLLDRIAAYRDRAEASRPDVRGPDSDDDDRIAEFRFETGPDGMIRWVEGAPRGPLVGIVIAVAAEQYGHGVDGHAAGAFRRRASFRDARLSVPGDGPASGEWRISAVPFFDHHDGRFTGYRGTARRPRADEIAAQPMMATGLYGSGLAPDALRQLVHELRTPLNAIVGFAEMIERQMLGPAGFDYRDRAADILDQGRRLLAAVDDLDMAARLESRRVRSAATAVDAAMLIERLHDDYEAAASPRGVKLAFRVAQALPPVDADPVAVERMFARLLAATIGLAERGETIFATLKVEAGQVRLAVSRPRLLESRDEHALLDPGYSPDGDWPDAPVLGLGFALRLIRNLAVAARGGLDIRGDSFELRLPAREAQQPGQEKA
ncbi:His Kinase A (phospho-acceptor) domain-containing protein [Sphingomonas laterariae]|uniref:histidine kinase n=1 Tax=Edaphosphingomonas laterariae TaxID=861865 RepID=A0A239FD07_9SPHN|nr:HAMP domain-containing sensor histidine kinase [Sphingomonas laterariae]SNS54042.1 His Kinase A (phospho-acceptor) domain-containing protein [Sphingomonas laterariae]